MTPADALPIEAPRSDRRPVVLVLLGCFGTGIEATGPNQNLLGMVRALSDRYRFRVLAQAVPGDQIGEWQHVQGVEQMPLLAVRGVIPGLRSAIAKTPHHMILSNGFFDRGFTIPSLIYRWLGLIARRPYLLAPHGEFSPGALEIKSAVKSRYLKFARMIGLLDNVAIQATTELEAKEIQAGLPFFEGDIYVTPVIRSVPAAEIVADRSEDGPLKIVFLSRIDRKKNLDYAISLLAEAGIAVEYDIYGPVTDEDYWRECQALCGKLPGNVRVRHKGVVTQRQVPEILARYDLFFMPTHGENFGHAIVDALAVGLPVLISDQTSWRDLVSRGAGWDIPLNDRASYLKALRDLAGAGVESRLALRRGARAYIAAELETSDSVRSTAKCLDEMLARHDERGARKPAVARSTRFRGS